MALALNLGRLLMATLVGIAVTIALLLAQAPHTAARTLPKLSPHTLRDLASHANLTKRWSACDWNAAAQSVASKPANQLTTTCDKALEKGQRLNCMLQSSDAASYASQWTDPNALKQYGYELEDDEDNDDYDMSEWATEFAALGITGGSWTLLQYTHTQESVVNGVTYPPTGALFWNAINEEAGALVGVHNINPDGENAIRNSQGKHSITPVPPLKQWSDITFLGLKLFSPTAPSSIRHVFRGNIIAEETKAILGYVIGQESIDDDNEWPGFEIRIDQIQAKAALASPNANGVAWFLGQHKTELGIRYIDMINVFACSGATNAANTRWCMYLHIADVEAGSAE